MKLVIFDLDQTLVDLVELHNDTTHRMLKRFFGIEAWLTEVEHAGRSQRDGMRDLAILKGVAGESFDVKADRLLDEFGADFSAHMPADMSKHVLPGAGDLLTTLSSRGHILALYTGDSPGVVDAVFRATGLGRFFSYRFSGTQFRRREDMIERAIEEVEKASGRTFRGKDIVVIGDSIRDVECGLKFNALTVGVTTGYYNAETLSQAGADLVVASLKDSEALLMAIGTARGAQHTGN